MTAMSLPLSAPVPSFDLPKWRANAGAAGVAVALHVAVAVALLGHDYTPTLPAPVVPVITTQLISVPAPAPLVEPVVVPEPPAPVPAVVEPPPPEVVKAPAPVVPTEAELAFKREQLREKQERVAEQKRQREEVRQRQEQQRQEQMAREAAEAREVEQQRVAAERRAADERARAAAAASQQYLPITKKAPDYPQRALDKGIQGDCTVSYTVDTQGKVRDPQVVDGCHPWFAQPSLQAARSFRYQPKIVDGRAVEVPGIKNTFHYSIEQGSR